MSAWRLNVAAVLIALAIGLVWLSSMPGRAFKAEESRLTAEGYALLPLTRITDPFAPKSLYLTCRSGVLGLSGVMVMPERHLFTDEDRSAKEIILRDARTTLHLNREPKRLPGIARVETVATFVVRKPLDRVSVRQVDKGVIAAALLEDRADRLALFSMELGFFFPLKFDPGPTRAFLDRCT